MKKYKFLFKPLFFIFSLLFASWMVLTIEKIRPSDFGKYESLFKSKANAAVPVYKNSQIDKKENFIDQNKLKKQFIKKLCSDYRAGKIDSVKLNEEIEHLFKVQ